MQPFLFCPTLPVFSFLSGFCIFKMPSRACIHLKDDKLLLLCVFSEEGQNGSRNEGSDYFFLLLLLGKKQISWPPLQHRSRKWLKCGWWNVRTSRDSPYLLLIKPVGGLPVKKHILFSVTLLLPLFKWLWNPFYTMSFLMQGLCSSL